MIEYPVSPLRLSWGEQERTSHKLGISKELLKSTLTLYMEETKRPLLSEAIKRGEHLINEQNEDQQIPVVVRTCPSHYDYLF